MRPARLLIKSNPPQLIDLEKLNFLIGRNGVGKTQILQDINHLLSGEVNPLIYANLPKAEVDVLIPSQINPSPSETWINTNTMSSFGIGKPSPRVEAFYEMDSVATQIGSRNNYLLSSIESEARKFGVSFGQNEGDSSNPLANMTDALLNWDGPPEIDSNADYSRSSIRSFLGDFREILLRVQGLNRDNDASSNPLWQFQTVLKVSSNEGKSTLLVRVPRSEQQFLEVTLALPKSDLEEILPSREFGQCLYPVQLAKNLGVSQAEALNKALRSVPEIVYRWDQDILIPLLEIKDFSSGPRAIFSAANIDLSKDENFVEAIVLEWAALIGRAITGYFLDPQVNWVYRLGSCAESATLANPFPPDPSPTSSRYRVHPAILIACKFISKYVSDNLPTFIKDDFSFHIEPLGPDDWIGRKRVRYGLVSKTEAPDISSDPMMEFLLDQFQKGPEITSLEYVGAGIRRWTLTVLSMLRGSASRCDVDGTYQDHFEEMLGEKLDEYLEVWDDRDYLWELWGAICEEDDLYEDVEVSLNDGGFLLIDEPEANLHPEGVESIRQWLVDQSVHFGTVVVVTHDIRVFDTSYPSTARYLVRRPLDSSNVQISRVASDPSVAAEWQREVGVSQGELFLATKRWLFVEGEVDRVILGNFFSSMLNERGVRILAARGSGNFQKLFQVEILRGLSASVSVLLDKEAPGTSGPDVGILRDSIKKGYFKRDLGITESEEASPKGTFLGVEELPVIDVMFYLDTNIINQVLFKDDATRQSMNKRPVPEWDAAWNEFVAYVNRTNEGSKVEKALRLTVSEFKKYLAREFGLQINPWLASRVSSIQAANGHIPLGLEVIVEKITSPFYGDVIK
jgi:energy-coupling factor transporter ATP-binding protein EcfA2